MKTKYKSKNNQRRAGAIVQWVGLLSCTWMTQVQSPTSHRVPQALPGVIPECRARNNPWASLGVTPKSKTNHHNQRIMATWNLLMILNFLITDSKFSSLSQLLDRIYYLWRLLISNSYTSKTNSYCLRSQQRVQLTQPVLVFPEWQTCLLFWAKLELEFHEMLLPFEFHEMLPPSRKPSSIPFMDNLSPNPSNHWPSPRFLSFSLCSAGNQNPRGSHILTPEPHPWALESLWFLR